MKHIRNQRGFSLTEVLASVTIFAIGASGLAATTLSSMKANRHSRQMTEAAALAHDKIEQLRSLDPSTNPPDLQDGVHNEPNNPISPVLSHGQYEVKWRVDKDRPDPGMSLVTVTVRWGKGDQRVKVETYICESPKCV